MTEETNNNENGNEIKETAPIEDEKKEIMESVTEETQGIVQAATVVEENTPDVPTSSENVSQETKKEQHQSPAPRGRQQGRFVKPQPYRNPRFKRRGCHFCQDKNLVIHYRKPEILEKFITDRGKILPRRISGACSKHQREIAIAIKRARILALLPFIVK